MRQYLFDKLKAYKKKTGHPLRIGIANIGGTLIAIPSAANPEELEPIKSKRTTRKVLIKGTGLDVLINQGLLDIQFIYHGPMDSSQELDPHRDKVLPSLAAQYPNFEGFLYVHGTDTGAETAKHLHVTCPYYDPYEFHKSGNKKTNWTKPLAIASSQEPAVMKTARGFIPNSGSDGDINLLTGIALIVEQKVGESGVLTNGVEAIIATTGRKITESHFPVYGGDPGVASIFSRTAFGLSYNEGVYLPTIPNRRKHARVIQGMGKFEGKVLIASEKAHLKLCLAYLESVAQKNTVVSDYLREILPQVILYESKGAGNVEVNDYNLLKRLEKEGIFVAKVPFPGGRVPRKMHYRVPGHDILGLNIEQKTAKYKAQATLAMAEELKIEQRYQSAFLRKIMQFQWGNEFLPIK